MRRQSITCAHCGKAFLRYPSKISKVNYCSRECMRAADRERARHTPGYYQRNDEDGVTRPAHRLLVEELLGRKLSDDEEVHHIDGDKKNNDPSNLKIVTPSEHKRLHVRVPEGHWTWRYAACRDCGGTSREHFGFGYCALCYKHRRKHGLPLAHSAEDKFA